MARLTSLVVEMNNVKYQKLFFLLFGTIQTHIYMAIVKKNCIKYKTDFVRLVKNVLTIIFSYRKITLTKTFISNISKVLDNQPERNKNCN